MSNKVNNHPYEELNEEQKAISIPYFVHEGEMYRVERLNKRWFVSFLIVLFMLFATNAGWLIYESQYETYQVEQDVDTGNGAAVVAGVGDANYGKDNAEDNFSGEEDEQQKPDEAMPQM